MILLHNYTGSYKVTKMQMFTTQNRKCKRLNLSAVSHITIQVTKILL